MRITNLTGKRILCSIDNERFELSNEQSIDVEDFEIAKFSHKTTSCSINEDNNSKVLKLLSFLDDPFKLRKEYHLAIDFEMNKSQLCDAKQITITANANYVDVETRTHYQYFVVKCDEKPILPNHTYISGKDKIKEDFKINNKSLVRWNAVWDVLIEPLIFEIIGYFLIYQLLAIWLGPTAWMAVFSLIMLNVLIEVVVLLFKTKSKREDRFYHYLEEYVVQEICYDHSISA